MKCKLTRVTADVSISSKDTDRTRVLYFNEVVVPPEPNQPPTMIQYGSATIPMTEAEAEAYTVGGLYEITTAPVAK